MPKRWSALLFSLGLLAGAPAVDIAGEPAGEQLPAFGDYVYVEELPQVVERAAPEYPRAARDAGVTGTVIVQALVGPDGRVRETRIQRSIPLLDGAAMVAVRQWRFQPAMTGGKPVAVWVAVPVRFSIDGRSEPATRSEPGGAKRGGAASSADSARSARPDSGRISADRLRRIPVERYFEHPLWPPRGVPPEGPLFDHPIWPPDRARVPNPPHEHPIWPPERPGGDLRFRPAHPDTVARPAPRPETTAVKPRPARKR